MLKLFKENIKIALGSIRTQLLRTILTVLIIAIGIWALVSILTVVAALENTLSGNFASMGSNTFAIEQYDMKSRIDDEKKENPIITYNEAVSFKNKFVFPSCNTSLAFTATSGAEVKYDNEKTDPEVSVLGVDDFYITNSGLELTSGRNFTPFDIQNNAPVCVVGADFEKGLFKNINGIDKIISIRGSKFKVIGILKGKGSTFGRSEDLRVMIPIQVARSMFSASDINYTVSVLVAKKELLDQASENALLLMRQVRKLNPVEDSNFGISRSDDLINKILSITQYLGISAWVIGIITIFGSSIALMNIMLVSVTERTREIGVRKALGATKSTIAWQFFMETLVIGQLGGLLGIILGILSGFGIASAMDFKFVIPWGAIIAAFITTFIVAIISGSFPALKAAKLDPIEALRYE